LTKDFFYPKAQRASVIGDDTDEITESGDIDCGRSAIMFFFI
jgi:hypothetical protein